jgi:hypothetical protein
LLSKNVNIKIYRTIIFPVVLYGCETWSLRLREECRLSVFNSRVLRRICGPKRDEVTGEWRRLHNEEIYALYSSPNIIRVIKSRRLRWVGHVANMGSRRGAYRALVGKLEGRRPLGNLVVLSLLPVQPHNESLQQARVINPCETCFESSLCNSSVSGARLKGSIPSPH